MKSRLSISIVICTFNNAESLRNTLSTVAALIRPDGVDCDVCLINNNSNDDTASVCDEFCSDSPVPARWFLESQQGLSHARNRGIQEAMGDFLVFTDDDVLVERNWIEQYAKTIRTLGADAVFGRIVPEWRGPEPSFYCTDMRPAYALLDYGSRPFIVRNRSMEFFGANFGCSKLLLRAIGGFNPDLGRSAQKLFVGEEREVFLALMDRQAIIAYEPEISVRHVIADKRKTKSYLRQYNHDIAVSLVHMADLRSNRTVCGIPLYKAKECLIFFALLLPRILFRAVTLNAKKLFVLELKTRTMWHLSRIYLARAINRPAGQG